MRMVVLFLIGLSVMAADKPDKVLKTQSAPPPLVFNKRTSTPAVQLDQTTGKLSLVKPATWEDAAYAELQIVVDLDTELKRCQADSHPAPHLDGKPHQEPKKGKR